MKELLLKFAIGIVFVNAIGQLAGSQIHILASTKLFAREVGFYLFLFIIFGLVTGFNVFLLDKKKGVLFFAFSSWVTAGVGFIFLKILQTDVAAQETLTMADVQQSWLLVIISISICLVGSIVIPLLSWRDAEGRARWESWFNIAQMRAGWRRELARVSIWCVVMNVAYLLLVAMPFVLVRELFGDSSSIVP